MLGLLFPSGIANCGALLVGCWDVRGGKATGLLEAAGCVCLGVCLCHAQHGAAFSNLCNHLPDLGPPRQSQYL